MIVDITLPSFTPCRIDSFTEKQVGEILHFILCSMLYNLEVDVSPGLCPVSSRVRDHASVRLPYVRVSTVICVI